MNQLYKKKEYIVIPVKNDYVIINTEKVFKEEAYMDHIMAIVTVLVVSELLYGKRK